ncbi:hypothetical protein EYF80_016326 [Liparis tanakae]|uniref:Uncharacterized protein n=1 Tax=Liparis tanakae TaxID=230148 RepID=A0A4Z2I7V6_9TELE|nr:hypothetical protein EYF80_016326 [Liparis tanakae]
MIKNKLRIKASRKGSALYLRKSNRVLAELGIPRSIQDRKWNCVTPYLVDVVDVRPFVRPVGVTLLHSVLRQRGQHDDDDAAALPHHLRSGRKPRETPLRRNQPFACVWMTRLEH